MLDQEMWTALPALPGRALDFKAELEGKSKGNSASTTPVTFPEWLELQNPWKRQTIGKILHLPVSSLSKGSPISRETIR